jgi:hypothetical protein
MQIRFHKKIIIDLNLLMPFLNIHQYLYRLHIAGFALALLPILLLTFFHMVSWEQLRFQAQWAWMAFIMLSLAIVFLSEKRYRKKIRETRTLTVLMEKLNRYYKLTIVRMASFCLAMLTLTIGYLLTADNRLTIAFFVMLLNMAWHWPGMKRLERDLTLTATERQAIEDWI